jgi:hypothetical protein
MKAIELWKTACAAIQEVQHLTETERKKFGRASKKLVPPAIPLGNGRQILTTQAGLDAVWDLADMWRSKDANLKAVIDRTSAGQLALQEFGQMLMENGSTSWQNNDVALSEYWNRLEKRFTVLGRDMDHYFPCHLLADRESPSFNVGPVRFLRRLDWLNHVAKVATKELDWIEIVSQKWASKAETELAIPKNHDAKTIGGIVGHCEWIAVVTVSGNEAIRSRDRAACAVRLAIDALGAILSPEQALRFRGPGDNLTIETSGTMTQPHGQRIHLGSSVDHPRIFGHAPHAQQFLVETSNFRDEAGWAIEAMLSLPKGIAFPALRQRWCDALYWFGDARRDSTDFMALVRYGMCLDVLAKGGRTKGIVAMLASITGLQPKDKFLQDGTTLEKVVKQIYEEGRSQFGHGGRPALLQELPISRQTADSVVQLALIEYVMHLKQYQGPDDADVFLAGLPVVKTAGIASPAP